MAKYLVTFNDQINDIEISGFKAMTDKEVDLLENLALSIKWPFSFQLTNYTLDFANGDDYITRLDFKEISNEEYKIINKTFNEGFGVFVDLEYLETMVEEDEEEYLRDEEEDSIFDDDDDFDDDVF